MIFIYHNLIVITWIADTTYLEKNNSIEEGGVKLIYIYQGFVIRQPTTTTKSYYKWILLSTFIVVGHQLYTVTIHRFTLVFVVVGHQLI